MKMTDGAPPQEGDAADSVVAGPSGDDAMLLAVLQHDPAWSWLHDREEDIYAEDDVRGERRAATLTADKPLCARRPEGADDPGGVAGEQARDVQAQTGELAALDDAPFVRLAAGVGAVA